MPRVKRGVAATRKRKKLLKHTKGFSWGRKTKERAAREALLHAWSHAWRGRKEKKRNFRKLWEVKINAALRARGNKYSAFIHDLNKAKVKINRKMLAYLAEHEPDIFAKIIEKIK